MIIYKEKIMQILSKTLKILLNISLYLVHCIFTLTFTTNQEKNYIP